MTPSTPITTTTTTTSTTTRTPPSTSLTLLRLSAIFFALLMLFLDSVHISQLKRSLTQYRLQEPPNSPPLPWPFSSFLSNPTSPDLPPLSSSSSIPLNNPSESDLHGYFVLLLLIPDLFVISMMAWLIWGRRCKDGMYHVGLRCGFFVLVVIWVLWWPVMEIERTMRYTKNMYGHLLREGSKKSWGTTEGAAAAAAMRGGVEDRKSRVAWMSLTRRRRRRQQQQQQQQQELKLKWEELEREEKEKEKEMQERVRLLDEDFMMFPEIVFIVPVPATAEAAAAPATDKDTTTIIIIGNSNTLTRRVDAPSPPALPPPPFTPNRVYEWTPPSAGSVYFCFLNHLDVAPYAPLISCGVYRTRNVFAFLLVMLLLSEMVLSVLKGEMSIMGAVATNTTAGPGPGPGTSVNTGEGSDGASSVSSTGATMGGNSALRAIPPIPAGVRSGIPPIPAGVTSTIPLIPVSARSVSAGTRVGMATATGLRGGAGGSSRGGVTSTRGSGIAGRNGERGIGMKDIL